jgi:hypothetical protein
VFELAYHLSSSNAVYLCHPDIHEDHIVILEFEGLEDLLSISHGVAYDVPPIEGIAPVGVDVGIRLMVGSNSFAAGGGPFMARMEHFESLPEALGIKGTTSAKRRQKRLVGREKRWARTMLHQTSRRFVNSLKDGEYIALEELQESKDSRKPCKDHPAALRGWAISRLLRMLSYNAPMLGSPWSMSDRTIHRSADPGAAPSIRTI